MHQLQIDDDYLKTGDQRIVRDLSGKVCYLIKGHWGRKGDRVELFSPSGQLLIQLKQKSLSLFPTFDILTPQGKIGQISKYPGLLGLKSPFFRVKPFNWRITGDFEKRHYQIKDGRDDLMTVQKVATLSGDRYYLFVYTEEYEALCTILSVIIDHLSQNRRSEKSKQENYDWDYGLLNFRLNRPDKIRHYRLYPHKIK